MTEKKFRIPGLWLLNSNGAVKINCDDIAYCYHNDDVTNIVYSGGSCTKAHVPLKKIEKRLSGKGFYRCHRNYLVNLKHVITIPEKGYTIKIAKEHNVKVARRRKVELAEMLSKITC